MIVLIACVVTTGCTSRGGPQPVANGTCTISGPTYFETWTYEDDRPVRSQRDLHLTTAVFAQGDPYDAVESSTSHVTSEYDEGRPVRLTATTERDRAPAPTSETIHGFGWDGGRLVSISQVMGSVLELEYDGRGRDVRVRRDNGTSEISWRSGRRLESISNGNVFVTYEYEGPRLVRVVTDLGGDSEPRGIEWIYDPRGRTLLAQRTTVFGIGDVKRFQRDGREKLTAARAENQCRGQNVDETFTCDGELEHFRSGVWPAELAPASIVLNAEPHIPEFDPRGLLS